MPWPVLVDYPVVAVPDLHGQRPALERLLSRLERLPEWPAASVVFLGDFVDRGPDVRGTLDLVLTLASARGGVAAVMGNHDLALVRPPGSTAAGRLTTGWSHRHRYDHAESFRSYLGRPPSYDDWGAELVALCEAIPEAHREALASLPWLVEFDRAPFPALRPLSRAGAVGPGTARRPEGPSLGRLLRPVPGTKTAAYWQTDYPVWPRADRRLSARPLPVPGRVQVTGHVHVRAPDPTACAIRLDTAGGHLDFLTACLLRSADSSRSSSPAAEGLTPGPPGGRCGPGTHVREATTAGPRALRGRPRTCKAALSPGLPAAGRRRAPSPVRGRACRCRARPGRYLAPPPVVASALSPPRLPWFLSSAMSSSLAVPCGRRSPGPDGAGS